MMGQHGVSVILCCYNSAGRIRETLEALAKQECEPALTWEIILVDNASTDQTSVFSLSVWEGLDTGIPLRIVYEELQGLKNARNRGIREASYPILLFCDDDNWLFPDYIQRVTDILSCDPALAACGGKGLPVFETTQPVWFNDYAEAFALGSQLINEEKGRVLNLYGAGLAVRKQYVDELQAVGFEPVLQGRVGSTLSSSEDVELSYAFVLRGYRLHYSDELQFFHYLPKGRLTLDYLERLFCAFGGDGPIRNLYYAQISDRFFHKKISNWNFHFALSLLRLIKYMIKPPKKKGRRIYFLWSRAYIKELIIIRSGYGEIVDRITRIKRQPGRNQTIKENCITH
ncbi:glycosyltransferase [Flavitalea flava]